MSTTTYRERLWPGPLGWSMVLGGAALGAITVTPLGHTAQVVAGVVVLTLLGAGVWLTSSVVEVVDEVFVAGRAHIPVTLLGEPHALDRSELHAALGPGSDARDFVLVRSWLPGAVSVAVDDPADPTPRWLVSTRRAEELVAAIVSAQAAHSEQIG
ncbi:DUF3093 domain-containing protein [Actinotalea sp. M2MS4P-6]|uniref:DUF3093 domain-containing protein n=1 Tax=Actinotalea sp. M2MS4P-6 TaxID=2983762 RepID=UPI0021E3A2E2|nr:DUF3093 domain-containing protein [Actinotalea sp. M2MS4P-6]MCV2396345.1 DUF3093 domain-containing protein [Actinotalea sp. M2MS4P-6]